MDPNKTVGRELEILLPVLAETMKFATQALAQSRVLADVLIEKGVVSQTELDAAIRKTPAASQRLMDILDSQIKKQN